MASKLDQLRAMTTVVADTGELGAVARLKPVDCTTSPTIVLKAIDDSDYRNVVEEALTWGRKRSGDAARVAAATADRLAVSVGVELLRLVPGFVSTEVDANLSFNIGALVARARQIVEAYKQRGVGPERLLIKLASTWEGIRAAEILESEGVRCNMSLLLNRAQAIASAEAGAFLISTFVGRVYDWHKKSSRKDFDAAEDPGVRSVRDIYGYYKSNGIETIVIGASFRNTGQIEALAGCDRLAIAPAFMDALASEGGEVKRVLAPTAAEPRSLRTASDGICHWFVSEDAVDIKHLDPAGPMDETTFRWIMNEDAMATEKLSEGIRVLANDLKTLRRRIVERLL
ncbi:transaldolase [Bradyrhizobium sp. DASA03076]|uniref:transaldolase n=1 Tax=Bradyrhizobium sp. BLXBL-03 TaxID=3395916 RepID=UPI003F70616F